MLGRGNSPPPIEIAVAVGSVFLLSLLSLILLDPGGPHVLRSPSTFLYHLVMVLLGPASGWVIVGKMGGLEDALIVILSFSAAAYLPLLVCALRLAVNPRPWLAVGAFAWWFSGCTFGVAIWY